MNDINSVLKNVEQKFVEVLYHISEYNIIFVEDKEMEKVIDEIGSRFFYDLYWMYWNVITIRICALMDPKSTFGNDNLSIPKLIDVVSSLKLSCITDVNLKKEIIVNKIRPFKKARNKVFGHYDLSASINKTKFERLELDDLKIICDNIQKILNLINKELGHANKMYGARISSGAMKLNKILKLGVEEKNNLTRL